MPKELRPQDAPITPEQISVFLEGGQFVFRTEQSQSVYVSDADAPGKSNCTGACAAAWPPVIAAAEAKALGDWSLVVRSNRAKQWAYKDKPIYTYAKDEMGKAGEGEKVPGWHLLHT